MDNKAPKISESPKEGQDLEHEVEQVSAKMQQNLLNNGSELPETQVNSLSFLKILADASSLFLGFTFIAGWSYVASYYIRFGLNPLELDFSLPVVCATAVYVLYSARWPLIVVAALLLGWMLIDYYRKQFRRGVTVVVLVSLLLTASAAGVIEGKHRANDDMLIDSDELPYVAFSSRLARTDQPNCVDYQTYGSFDCKLLLHSKGTYYFFTPVPRPEEALIGVGSLNVYTLADSDVTGVHILRGLERNAREK